MVARTAKQVVILGGTGFIGRRLVETLGLQGHGVRVPIRVRAYMAGAGLNLCGPCISSCEELVQFMAHVLGRKRLIIGLPDPISRI